MQSLPRLGAVVAITVLGTSPDVLAYRPFESTDASVVGAGEVEIELGYAGFRLHEDHAAIVAPTVVVNVGLLRNLELVGDFEFVSDVSAGPGRQQQSRVEHAALSLKGVLRDGALQEQGVGPSLAVEISALLPTLSGERRPGAELIGIASHSRGPWRGHVNAGGVVTVQDGHVGFVWGVIIERWITKNVRQVVEANGESIQGSAPDSSLLLGIVWRVTAPRPLDEVVFDVGIRRGLSAAAAEWSATTGVTVAVPR